jgi:hypothetical protein
MHFAVRNPHARIGERRKRLDELLLLLLEIPQRLGVPAAPVLLGCGPLDRRARGAGDGGSKLKNETSAPIVSFHKIRFHDSIRT